MDEEFLIILGDWHDGLHYPTREGTPGGKEWEPRNFSLFERCSFFSFIYYDDFLIIIYIYIVFFLYIHPLTSFPGYFSRQRFYYQESWFGEF